MEWLVLVSSIICTRTYLTSPTGTGKVRQIFRKCGMYEVTAPHSLNTTDITHGRTGVSLGKLIRHCATEDSTYQWGASTTTGTNTLLKVSRELSVSPRVSPESWESHLGITRGNSIPLADHGRQWAHLGLHTYHGWLYFATAEPPTVVRRYLRAK